MKPLYILVSVFGISSLLFWFFTDSWNLFFCGNLAMGVMLCFTALGHFMFPKGMAMMIPPIVPFRKTWVYLTGVAEIAFGIALLFPISRLYAGYGLLVFFVLILPANIYAALHHINLEKGTTTGPGPSYLWFRIPLQIFFLTWVAFFATSCYPDSH